MGNITGAAGVAPMQHTAASAPPRAASACGAAASTSAAPMPPTALCVNTTARRPTAGAGCGRELSQTSRQAAARLAPSWLQPVCRGQQCCQVAFVPPWQGMGPSACAADCAAAHPALKPNAPTSSDSPGPRLGGHCLACMGAVMAAHPLPASDPPSHVLGARCPSGAVLCGTGREG